MKKGLFIDAEFDRMTGEGSVAMIGCGSDRPFIEWAKQHCFSYYYTDDVGVPPGSLKMYIGLITIYIHQGKLVRLLADSSGELIDQMMCELSELFGLCATCAAYQQQARCGR